MKTIIIIDHDGGAPEIMPLQEGGFLTICEAPMRLVERIDNAPEGTVTLKLQLQVLPPSEEGKMVLENPAE